MQHSMMKCWTACVVLLALCAAAGALPAPAAFYSFDSWRSTGAAWTDTTGNEWYFQLVDGEASSLSSDARFGAGALALVREGQFGVVGFPISGAQGAAFSVSMWIKPASSSSGAGKQFLVHNQANPATDSPFWALVRRDALVFIEVGTGAGASVSSTIPLVADSWNHVVVVRTAAGTTKVVVNGSQQTSVGVPGSVESGPNALIFVGGQPPHAPIGATDTFIGLIDNVRMYAVALADAEVLELHSADSGPPAPLPYPPTGYSASFSKTVRTFGSSPGGIFDESVETTGDTYFDASNSRAVLRGITSDAGSAGGDLASFKYIFSTQAGEQIEAVVQWDTSDISTRTCSVRRHGCPSWPTQFACLPNGAVDCEPATCPTAGFWTIVTWEGPPPRCEMADTAVLCHTEYAFGSTAVTTAHDGTPRVFDRNACTPSHQSSSCTDTLVAFSNVGVGPVPDSAFQGEELEDCFTPGSSVCSAFCNGRGDCDPATPGTCICDDPSAWTGAQCDTPVDAQCSLGEWSAWGGCSSSCGGGTQTRTASYLPPASNPDMACVTVVETQSRVCNTDPCPNVACAGCVLGTSGPCRNDNNYVCYGFYAGTTTCPAGTTQCSSNCDTCAGSTYGPCKHINDGSCFSFQQGTSQCPAGTVLCSDVKSPELCTGCWPGTVGACQQSNTVCWGKLPSGRCPAGAAECAVSGSLPPAAVAVLDLELEGVVSDSFRSDKLDAFSITIANVADVPVLNVGIEAVRPAADEDWTWTGNCNAGSCEDRGVRIGFIVVPEPSERHSSSSAHEVVAKVDAAVQDGSLRSALVQQGISTTSVSAVTQAQVLNDDSTMSDGSGSEVNIALVALAGTAAIVVVALVVALVVVLQRRRKMGDRSITITDRSHSMRSMGSVRMTQRVSFRSMLAEETGRSNSHRSMRVSAHNQSARDVTDTGLRLPPGAPTVASIRQWQHFGSVGSMHSVSSPSTPSRSAWT